MEARDVLCRPHSPAEAGFRLVADRPPDSTTRDSQGEQGACLGDEVDEGDHGKEDADDQAESPLGTAKGERGSDPGPRDDPDHEQDGQPPVDVPEGGVGDRGRNAEDAHADQRGAMADFSDIDSSSL